MSYKAQVQEMKNNLLETNNTSSPDSSPNHIQRMKHMSEYQGNQIEEKRNHIFRLGFVNINRIPKSYKNPKNSNIHDILLKYNFDYFGFAEVNCYWPRADDEDR